MKSAITISLVPEAAGGPFVFWHDLAGACQQASELGFDAIEIFPPSGAIPEINLNGLALAAMGTGAGWVKHKLTLTSPDQSVRQKAQEFIRGIISTAATLGAPAIIGSMQGRAEVGMPRSQSLGLFRQAVAELADHAASQKQMLLLEPLNRYETNLLNTAQQGLEFLDSLRKPNVKLLLDLFHMNIEEQDIAGSIRKAGSRVGHVHLADSNRRAAGFGHTDFAPIIKALREINFTGYLSAEILPLPSPEEAAAQTIQTFKSLTLSGSQQV